MSATRIRQKARRELHKVARQIIGGADVGSVISYPGQGARQVLTEAAEEHFNVYDAPFIAVWANFDSWDRGDGVPVLSARWMTLERDVTVDDNYLADAGEARDREKVSGYGDVELGGSTSLTDREKTIVAGALAAWAETDEWGCRGGRTG